MKNKESKKIKNNKTLKINVKQILFIFVLIVLSGLIVFQYYQQNEQKTLFENNKKSIEKLSEKTEIQNKEYTNLFKEIKEIKGFNKNIEEKNVYFNEQIQKLQTNAKPNINDNVRLTEIGFLIHQASIYYSLNKNQKATIKLLKLAKNKLKKTNVNSLFDLKKALTNDILMLNIIQEEDITEDYLKLEFIVSSIDQWQQKKLIEKVIKIKEKEKKEGVWQHAVSTTKNVLKKWFRVTTHNNKIVPPLNVSELITIKQIIKLKAEEANYALMRNQMKLYINILTNIKKLLVDRFNLEQKIIKDNLKSINELINNNIRPKSLMTLRSEKVYSKLINQQNDIEKPNEN